MIGRIEALLLPPAWEDVWICALADGHVQETGVDATGRPAATGCYLPLVL